MMAGPSAPSRFRLLLGACLAWGAGPAGAAEPIRIAVPVPRHDSGEGARPLEEYARAVVRGVRLAVEEVGGRGLPAPVEVRVVEAETWPATGAAEAAERIARDVSVVAVIGHLTSSATLAAARVYARHGLALVAPVASDDALTEAQARPDWPGSRNLFRVAVPDRARADFAADFILKTLKLDRVAILYSPADPTSRALAEAARRRIGASGGSVVAFVGGDIPENGGTRAGDRLLARLRRGEPEVVLVVALPDPTQRFLAACGKAKLGLPRVLTQLSLEGQFLKDPDPAADGAYLAAIDVGLESLPGGPAFAERHERKFPGVAMTGVEHFAYDAAFAVLAAIVQAGAPVRRRDVIEMLRRTRYSGLLGTTAFDERGEPAERPLLTSAQLTLPPAPPPKKN